MGKVKFSIKPTIKPINRRLFSVAPIHLGAVAFCLLVAWLAYGRLLHGYFATDEWWAFSFAIANRHLRDAIMPSGVFAPSANLFIYFLYYRFGLNEHVWAWLTLITHTVNVILVYTLTVRLSGRWTVGLLTAALFAMLPMGSQFVDQFSMLPTSGMATLFGLGALVAYAYRRPIIAGLLFLISLSFSAYAVPFLLLAATFEIALIERRRWWQALIRFIPIVTAFALYYYALSQTTLKSAGLHDRPAATSEHGLLVHLQHIGQKIYQGYGEILTTLPGTIDPKQMLYLSHWVTGIAIMAILLLLWRRQFVLAKTALIGYLWIPCSLALFSTLNTVAVDATFPSRYFYVTTVGLGLFLGSVIAGLFGGWKLRMVVVGDAVIIVLLVALLANYLPKTRGHIADEVKLGQTRKMILTTITQAIPKLGRDAIFCFTSNTANYAAPPEVIPMPFIHNFAFNLAVYYRAKAYQLHDFFTESGYFVNPAASFYYFSREKSDPDGIGPGIGFATSMPDCAKVHGRFGFVGVDSYYGFAYDGNKPSLTDITPAVRSYLRGETVPDTALYPWR